MRPGQNKRSRGRNGGGHMGGGHMGGGGHGGGGPHQHRGPRPPHRIQTFDSNGPNVKIRGNAYQVFERYLAMAREAQSSGDPVAAENFYQHAEHYYRVMQAAGEAQQLGQQQGQQRSMTPADTEMTGGENEAQAGYGGDGQEQNQAQVQIHQPHQPHHSMEPQPQPAMPNDQPDDEQPPYRDEQPPYRDGQPPGF